MMCWPLLLLCLSRSTVPSQLAALVFSRGNVYKQVSKMLSVQLDLAELDKVVLLPLGRGDLTKQFAKSGVLYSSDCSLIGWRIRSHPASISAYAHFVSDGAESTIGSIASRRKHDISSPNSLEYASSFSFSLSKVPVSGVPVLDTLVTRTYLRIPIDAKRLIFSASP